MNALSNRSGGWRKMLKRPFEIFDRGLELVEKSILIVSILAMAVVSMINVISRNLGSSVRWADEVASLLVVVVTFVGLGHGVRMARHIRVSAIHDVLAPKAQKALIVFISLTSALLLFVLGLYAMDYVEKLIRSGRRVPSLGIPVYYIYLIVPVGLFIGAAQYFLAFVRNLVSRNTWLSWQHRDEYEEDLDTDAVGVNDTDPAVALASENKTSSKGGS